MQYLRLVHTRELASAAPSCNTLPEQSSLVCTNDFLRKICCAAKRLLPSFAPSYQTGLIWGSKLQGQICCTSLYQEQAPLCVLKFARRDMTCLQLAKQIGLLFSVLCPNRVVSSLSFFVLSFVCTGWGTYPGVCFWSVFQEQAPSCVPAFF